jgi:quercetin dioxygenase-like cupin family protein
MSTVSAEDVPVYGFDDRHVTWSPLAGLAHFEFALCDLDEERQVVDLLVKFAPGKLVALHNHLAQTNMLVIAGELRMYELDGTLKEIRPPGRYVRGRRDDAHSEGGGAQGAVVFYSVRGHGDENLLQILDDVGGVVATLGMADMRAAWAARPVAR